MEGCAAARATATFLFWTAFITFVTQALAHRWGTLSWQGMCHAWISVVGRFVHEISACS
jgi:hypothetical protein